MAQIEILRKGILISIKPSYARMILEGSKTIELRRRFSLKFPPNTKMYIYATDPVKAIIGECEIKTVKKLPIDQLWSESCRDAMIDWESFQRYFNGLEYGYALLLSKPLVYGSHILLKTLPNEKISAPQSYRTVDFSL